MAKKLSIQEKARRMWIRALRSGKYGWGKHHLSPMPNQYCCLGVLCEVAISEGIIKSYTHQNAGLPIKVKNWVGINSDIGNFGTKGENLASKNDYSARNPFKRIASLIEKEPEGLFIDEVSN